MSVAEQSPPELNAPVKKIVRVHDRELMAAYVLMKIPREHAVRLLRLHNWLASQSDVTVLTVNSSSAGVSFNFIILESDPELDGDVLDRSDLEHEPLAVIRRGFVGWEFTDNCESSFYAEGIPISELLSSDDLDQIVSIDVELEPEE